MSRILHRSLLATLAMCSLILSASRVCTAADRLVDLPAGLKVQTPEIPEQITGVLHSVNARLMKDVSPAQNAAVFVVQVLGPQILPPKLQADNFVMLGIESLPESGPRLLYPWDYSIQVRQLKEPELDQETGELRFELQQASAGPWTADLYPRISGYLAANQQALDLFRDAASLPVYYAPLLCEEEPPRLLSASLAIEKQLMFPARLLAVRAMQSLAGGNFAAASADLMAIHRWSNLLATGSPFDVSVAKAQVMDAFACHATLNALQAGLWSGPGARDHLTALRELPAMPRSPRSVDWGERAIVHQELDFLKSDPESVAGFFELPENDDADRTDDINLKDVQWEVAQQRADAIFDEFVAALKIESHAEQLKKFAELDTAEAKWREKDEELSRQFPEELRKDAKAASLWIGETMAMSLKPNCYQRRHSDDRQQSRRDVLHVALALWVARTDLGKYPEQLADLAPKFLPSVPVDAFSEKPLIYERRSDQVILFGTLGPNQQNDAGSRYNDDTLITLEAPPSR